MKVIMYPFSNTTCFGLLVISGQAQSLTNLIYLWYPLIKSEDCVKR